MKTSWGDISVSLYAFFLHDTPLESPDSVDFKYVNRIEKELLFFKLYYIQNTNFFICFLKISLDPRRHICCSIHHLEDLLTVSSHMYHTCNESIVFLSYVNFPVRPK